MYTPTFLPDNCCEFMPVKIVLVNLALFNHSWCSHKYWLGIKHQAVVVQLVFFNILIEQSLLFGILIIHLATKITSVVNRLIGHFQNLPAHWVHSLSEAVVYFEELCIEVLQPRYVTGGIWHVRMFILPSAFVSWHRVFLHSQLTLFCENFGH